MSFPLHWADALFAKLSIRYGSAFLAQWPDADPSLVKSDWCDVLTGFGDKPEAIKYALEHLPEKPPTAMQFRAICNLAPLPVFQRLPEPKADPAKARAAIEAAMAAVKRMP